MSDMINKRKKDKKYLKKETVVEKAVLHVGGDTLTTQKIEPHHSSSLSLLILCRPFPYPHLPYLATLNQASKEQSQSTFATGFVYTTNLNLN